MRIIKTIILLLTALWIWPVGIATAAVDNAAIRHNTLEAAADLHLPFIENRGQVPDPDVAYVADTFACRAAVTRDGQLIYSLARGKSQGPRAVVFREHLVGDAVTVDVRGREPMDMKVGYFQGRDPARWLSNLHSYARVALGHIDAGIRVELKAHGRNVEKLFYLAPGADPANIRLSVQGADAMRVGDHGELELTATDGGIMRFSKPVAYQIISGKRHMVPARYRVDRNEYGFELGAYDPSRQLVIDPLISVFAIKYNDDCVDNAIMDVTADAQGNIYAAGYANQQLAIWKLDRRMDNVLAAAFFSVDGRYWVDIIHAIALDSQGNVFVAGTTYNTEFPVTPGCHDAIAGDHIVREGFVAKYSNDLQNLLAATYIGGDNTEELYDMAINSHDEVYVVGYSKTGGIGGQSFPVTPGAFDTTPAPAMQKKAVVVRMNNNLKTVLAATFLGGSVDDNLDRNEDVAYSLALDSQGSVWVAGRTNQPDFPVTPGCLDPAPNGAGDVFLSKLDADLRNLLVSTHIGGSEDEAPTDLLLDSQGNIYVTGWTFSGNFPIPAGGFDTSHGNHEEDGFILKLNSTARQVMAGTFLGGTADGSNHGDDIPAAMALSADASQLVVVGRTESASFPTTPGCLDNTVDVFSAALPDRSGNTGDVNWGDGFISVLSGNLDQLVYSTFVGGGGADYFDAVLLNGDDLLVAGETQSGSAFPMAPISGKLVPRAVLMRFNESETPANPGGTPNTAGGGSGGGGGGGCFVDSCLR